MIASHQVVPLLLEACPESRTAWEDHLAWWKGEPAGSYNDVTAFVRFLVERLERGEGSCLGAAFDVIERVLTEGDEEAKALAVWGFIEDLQNLGADHADALRRWLGPEAARAWEEVDQWWGGLARCDPP